MKGNRTLTWPECLTVGQNGLLAAQVSARVMLWTGIAFVAVGFVLPSYTLAILYIRCRARLHVRASRVDEELK